MALVPEFLCVISGVVNQIGDIAVMQRGDIAVSAPHMCTTALCASQQMPCTLTTHDCTALVLHTLVLAAATALGALPGCMCCGWAPGGLDCEAWRAQSLTSYV